MFLRYVCLSIVLAVAVNAQATSKSKPSAAKSAAKDDKDIKLGADEPGCVDSTLLPRVTGCNIIQCDKKDNQTVEVQIGGTPDGGVDKDVKEGPTEIIYYLCPAKINLANIVKQSEAAMVKAGFKPVFVGKDGDEQPIVTAAKDLQFIQISTYMYNEYSAYVLTAVQDPPEPADPAPAADPAKKP